MALIIGSTLDWVARGIFGLHELTVLPTILSSLVFAGAFILGTALLGSAAFFTSRAAAITLVITSVVLPVLIEMVDLLLRAYFLFQELKPLMGEHL